MSDIGYIRVSTSEQNLSRQLESVKLEKIFEEKISSTATTRPVLIECMNYLREGDTLHVHCIDRLARNLGDLQNIVSSLNEKGVIVHFHTENMIFTSNASPLQELLFQILGAFAQFEKNLIRERQQEGIERAKKEGRHLGRPRKISLDDRKQINEKLKEGKSPAVIAEEYGVSVSSVYKLQSSNDKT